MTDVFAKKKRSEIMSRIRSKNTSLEKMVFSFLRKNEVYFQKHYKRVKGNPDIAVPSKRKAVFIDGDFWHGWKFREIEKRLPNCYWREKIKLNIKRDVKNRKFLKKNGWKVLRVWEHELENNFEKAAKKIMGFLE